MGEFGVTVSAHQVAIGRANCGRCIERARRTGKRERSQMALISLMSDGTARLVPYLKDRQEDPIPTVTNWGEGNFDRDDTDTWDLKHERTRLGKATVWDASKGAEFVCPTDGAKYRLPPFEATTWFLRLIEKVRDGHGGHIVSTQFQVF